VKRILTVFLAAVLFLDAVSLGVLLFTRAKNGGKNNNGEVDVFSRATVLAVGENLVGDEINEQASAGAGSVVRDYSLVYENIADDVEKADVAIFSQNIIMSADHPVSGYPLYNSPEELGNELVKIGFDVVNMAGSHSLDYGEQGMLNTLNAWLDRGIVVTGAYEKEEDALNPVIREANGVRIAYIGFTESSNGNSLPGDSSAELMMAEYETQLNQAVKNAKERADIVIVLADWGNEYETEITTAQTGLAAKLGEWGADVIIGTHPHVLQTVEYITNKDGSQTLVAYSLGNLVSAAAKKESVLGGALTFDVVKNNDTGAVAIENVSISGIVTHYGIDMSKIRVYKLSEYTDELAEVHGIKEKAEDFSVDYLNSLMKERINRRFLR